MLNNQTAALLRDMKLPAMAAEFLRQLETPAMEALDFAERIGMMVDAEKYNRESNRIKRLTKAANLRISTACFADIDYRPSRRLDRAYIARLSDFKWVREARNIILTGSTGTGKTWLACAFGAEACRKGMHVGFYRVNRLINELIAAQTAGIFEKTIAKLRKLDVLILDDWGLAGLSASEGRYLLEVFEERYGKGATIISAQVPVLKWHDLFEDPTVADAALDRLVNNAYRFELKGHSLRSSTYESQNPAMPCGTQDQNIDVQHDISPSEDGEHHE